MWTGLKAVVDAVDASPDPQSEMRAMMVLMLSALKKLPVPEASKAIQEAIAIAQDGWPHG